MHEIENNSHGSNRIRVHNHFVHERKLNHFAKLVKWLSVHLQNKFLWVWIPLLSLKLNILRLFQKKGFLDIQATMECRFTLKTGTWQDNSIQSIITIFTKQNYNSAKPFGTEIDLLWQSMFSTHFLNKYKGLYSLQRFIFRTISNISDGAFCKNS